MGSQKWMIHTYFCLFDDRIKICPYLLGLGGSETCHWLDVAWLVHYRPHLDTSLKVKDNFHRGKIIPKKIKIFRLQTLDFDHKRHILLFSVWNEVHILTRLTLIKPYNTRLSFTIHLFCDVFLMELQKCFRPLHEKKGTRQDIHSTTCTAVWAKI